MSQEDKPVSDTLQKQLRDLVEATKQANGKPVKVPVLLREEGMKFMRGEKSLLDQLPIGDLMQISSAMGEEDKPEERVPAGPATAEDQSVYDSIAQNYKPVAALEAEVERMKSPAALPQWMRDLEVELKMSTMRHAFTFTRDETLELMGISINTQAALYTLRATIERQRKVIELSGQLLPKRIDDGFVQFGKYFAEQEDVFNDPYSKMCQFKRQYLTMCQEVLRDIAELEKGVV